MTTDTASFQTTARVGASGPEAIRTAREFAASIAADERYDLSRHWRNARTHASHDPVAWKYRHIGNYLLNDVLPPNHGQI